MDINTLTAVRVKETRLKQGLSAEAVAMELGLSKSSYSRLENGQTEITLVKIEALS